MPVFKFSFPLDAVGLTLALSGDYTGSATIGAGGVYQLEVDDSLDETSRIVGEVSSALLGTLQTRGVYLTQASIEASGGGVGAAETAYFVATGPVYATDAGGSDTLVFVADDRHGALPDWSSITSGDIVLSEDAGTTVFAIAAVVDIDFSEASGVSAAPGSLGVGSIVANLDGSEVLNISDAGTVGDGQDLQTSDALRGGGLLPSSGTLSVGLQPYAKDASDVIVADGVATPRVALTITRIAQAAVLPD